MTLFEIAGYTAGFMAVVLATANYLINKSSTKFEKYLETHKKTALKPMVRRLYNLNLKLNSVLLTSYHKFLKPRQDGLIGEYGGKVDHLILYPIKASTTGFKVKQWELTSYGLKYDRIYMFSTYNKESQQYETINLSKAPKLITLKIKQFNELSKSFTFEYIDTVNGRINIFELPCEPSSEFISKYSSFGINEQPTKVWFTKMEGYVLDLFLSSNFKTTFNLPEDTVLICSKNGKPCSIGVPKQLATSTMFQDYFPLLTTSQESFNSVVKDAGEAGSYVQMESFRPNLVISGVSKPFDEEFYDKFDIISGSDSDRFNFTTCNKCARCTIPNIDPKTGISDKKNTISRRMSKYRRTDDGNPYSAIFGIYTVNHQTGVVLKAGDVVDLLCRKSKSLAISEDPFR